MTILIIVFVLLLVLLLMNGSHEKIKMNVRRGESKLNDAVERVVKIENSRTDSFRQQRSPERFDLLSDDTKQQYTMNDLIDRLVRLERKVDNLADDSRDKQDGYPTVEQLVVMRRDIDNLSTIVVPKLLQTTIQTTEERLREQLRVQLNERLDRALTPQFREQMKEYVRMQFEERLNTRLNEKMVEQFANKTTALNEELKQKLNEQLNTTLLNYLQQHVDTKITERTNVLLSKLSNRTMSNVDNRTTSSENIDNRAVLNETMKKCISEQIKEETKNLFDALTKRSICFASTNVVRVTWFDALGSFLNENNQLLHSYMDYADVIIAHGVTLNENRFFSHLRKVGSVDIFHPVHGRRSQFLALVVTGPGEKKKTLMASGFCLNPNLNFQFDRTKVYESKNARLLTVWGLLFDQVYTVFGAFLSVTADDDTKEQRDDRLVLLERLNTDVKSMGTYEKTTYRSNEYRVFLLGDFGITNNSFQLLRNETKDKLRCEFDSCVKGSIITSLTNGFYHNVHALTNTTVLDFDAKQTLNSSMCVRVAYATHDHDDDTNTMTNHRRRYGATTDTTHDRIIK